MENLRTINTTVVFIQKGNKILLGEKKRGFAKGTFNGIGGKQDPGETIDQAMVRETQEEIGVTPTKFENVGLIKFDMWYKGEHANMNLFVYMCSEFTGEIKETEEMIPQWFEGKDIPYDKMLQTDIVWIPSVLQGNYVVGKCVYDQNLVSLSNDIKIISKNELNNEVANELC